ncbi:MAG TPA: 2-C-methyl-D-erythritol 4-phosphate cytidylyltransferase [Galbitalea sp.]|jgi:2-C-methyl-D-erythritol 4-phosphate cytidylyltransferase/2-C-methyl-D-erythritol 2,4-cyclodiphosphate synthase|nr:2-C-methyl-D-erythritol 4-phosphate cytidylyltransferase [Galbitalea sp.]
MTSTATVGVIVVAAGSGSRLGADLPKAFVSLGGRSILQRALEPVFGMSEPAQIVVVVPSERFQLAQDEVRDAAGAAIEYASVVIGGATRQLSVAAGLDALWPDVGVVLVHDAARPFTPTALFEAVVARVRESGQGVIPGIPVADTLKRMDADVALETIDRSVLSAIQTPQGFPRVELTQSYAVAAQDYTDDAAVFAAAGHTVRVIQGDSLAFKITTPWDLRRAQSLVEVGGFRSGIGIDIHAYDKSVPLWLGGLHWPDEPGLAGHSDGDALSHAICDALLSAAGLGDLGSRFGTDDPHFANAHGEVFLRATLELITGAGFVVQNVAVQVIGNRPRLASRRGELEMHLGEVVGAPVSVAATTADGLGFIGRGEGIAAIATALLSS